MKTTRRSGRNVVLTRAICETGVSGEDICWSVLSAAGTTLGSTVDLGYLAVGVDPVVKKSWEEFFIV
jgi:hypothetical protein